MTSDQRVGDLEPDHPLMTPYAPSWFDRLDAWLTTLPTPRWLVGVTLAVLLVLVNALFKWWDGVYPVGTFHPFHVVVISYTIWYFAMVSYLDWVAARAMERFRPAFRGDERTFADLTYRLTTMPARPAALASLAGAVFGLLVALGVQRGLFISPAALLMRSPSSLWFDFLVAIVVNMGLYVFIYHTVHQLRVVNTIYGHHAQVDLFLPGPLRAFSTLTAQTAAAGVLTAYVWFATETNFTENPVSLSVFVVLVLLAGVTFAAPLWGVHRMLESAQHTAQAAAGQRLHRALGDLHECIDRRTYGEADALAKAVAGIKDELALLERIPTWPWQPDTPRLLSTAILLPIVLWLATRLLERLLGM